MLMIKKMVAGDHFTDNLSASKWLSNLFSIGQVGCHSYNSSDDNVPRGSRSKESKLEGEQTFLIKENLKQTQNSVF